MKAVDHENTHRNHLTTLVALVALLAACGDDGGGGGSGLGESLDDLQGDTPPADLVGFWQAYDSSDPIFQYYDPATGQWSGNGMYSEIRFDEKGAYEEIDILQTGAGSGCPSALYLHFQGTIRIDADVITLERVRGRSVGDDCTGRRERTTDFVDAVYGWSIDENGVLALGDPASPQDGLLYARGE